MSSPSMTALGPMPRAAAFVPRPEDLTEALGLLTVLPLGGRSARRGGAAAWAWPLAGLVVAVLAALLGWLLGWIGLVPGVVAAAILAAQALLTGALHEDGLADAADGLFGGRDAAQRLAIMKDHHHGTFGVLALLLSVLARWSALTFLLDEGHLLGPLLAAALLSRAVLPVAMVALPPARREGLSAATGRPPRLSAALGLALALGLSLLWLGWAIFAAAAAAGVMAVATALLARERIGGQTGDILGAMQQLAELGVLAALCAAL